MTSITVIVPVYKVEKELPRCIESILSQSDYIKELLLIDDGSPDSCGRICDKYAEENQIIRVIHQDNKGVSAVRNRGIAESKGEYISFIDSDDYILDGLYAKAQELIEDIKPCIITYEYLDSYEKVKYKYCKKNARKEIRDVLSSEEAIDQLFFKNRVDVIPCNKIVKKELFSGVFFPEGYVYEDLLTTYKYVSKASSVVCIRAPYYVYCHRPESIASQPLTAESHKIIIKAVEEIYSFGKNFCYHDNNLSVGYAYWRVVIANMMFRSDYVDEVYICETRNFIKQILGKIMENKLLGTRRKIGIILFANSPDLYKWIYRRYLSLFR